MNKLIKFDDLNPGDRDLAIRLLFALSGNGKIIQGFMANLRESRISNTEAQDLVRKYERIQNKTLVEA